MARQYNCNTFQYKFKRKAVHTDSRISNKMFQINQPQNIQIYNIYLNCVDHHDQFHVKYDVG